MNLKNGKVFTSKSVGTGPSYYGKRIYPAAVSQRLRNTVLELFCGQYKPEVDCSAGPILSDSHLKAPSFTQKIWNKSWKPTKFMKWTQDDHAEFKWEFQTARVLRLKHCFLSFNALQCDINAPMFRMDDVFIRRVEWDVSLHRRRWLYVRPKRPHIPATYGKVF